MAHCTYLEIRIPLYCRLDRKSNQLRLVLQSKHRALLLHMGFHSPVSNLRPKHNIMQLVLIFSIYSINAVENLKIPSICMSISTPIPCLGGQRVVVCLNQALADLFW